MATCTLKIELDDPSTPRTGGDSISGTVHVTATGSVNCAGLVVSTCWTTHGRGNVEKGDVDTRVLFQGTWEAGGAYRYPFTLRSAAWPPTYYGTLLNVSHFVVARAKVPWSSDPKTQVEFPVVAAVTPTEAPSGLPVQSSTAAWIGWIVGASLLLVLGAIFGVWLLFILPILGLAAAGYWFCRVFLPRRLLGPVECTVEPVQLAAGATINGRLRCTPRRNVTTDGIQWSLSCVEKCVSGSGSNKTTHRHEVFATHVPLAPAGLLRMGQPQAFEFACPIPHHAPVSLKLKENELSWLGTVRIAIPRWPDWVQLFPVTVVPSGLLPAAARSSDAAGTDEPYAAAGAEEDAWFAEVIGQVQRSRRDPKRLQTVLAAVRDQVFSLCIDIAGPRAEPPPQMPAEAGTWLFAVYRPQDEQLCLLWPAPLVPPAQHASNWHTTATILGWDEELDCLLMRVVPHPSA